jgi:hypothetical protein
VATFSHGDLETLWQLAGGNPAKSDIAAAIAQAESGGCQYAQRGPVDIRPVKQCVYVLDPVRYVIGLWQINQTAHPTYDRLSLFNALDNAKAAVAISGRGADFSPWVTYTNGRYRDFLQASTEPAPQPGGVLPTPAGAVGPQGHRGYADLRNSLGRHLPTQLDRSRRTGLTVLHQLAAAGKVRRK